MKSWQGPPVELGPHGRPVAAQLHRGALSGFLQVGRLRREGIRRDPAGHAEDGRARSRSTPRSWTSTIREKKVALAVDEWGAWYAQLPGTTPGFLAQQNSVRDAIIAALNINIFARHADRVRMANIAQMVNVLQAMILTDGPKMVLTPTYHVVPDVRAVPGRDVRAGRPSTPAATRTATSRCRASTRSPPGTRPARCGSSLTNVDPHRPAEIATTLAGITAASASGETLTGAGDRQRQHVRGAEHRRARNRPR